MIAVCEGCDKTDEATISKDQRIGPPDNWYIINLSIGDYSNRGFLLCQECLSEVYSNSLPKGALLLERIKKFVGRKKKSK